MCCILVIRNKVKHMVCSLVMTVCVQCIGFKYCSQQYWHTISDADM